MQLGIQVSKVTECAESVIVKQQGTFLSVHVKSCMGFRRWSRTVGVLSALLDSRMWLPNTQTCSPNVLKLHSFLLAMSQQPLMMGKAWPILTALCYCSRTKNQEGFLGSRSCWFGLWKCCTITKRWWGICITTCRILVTSQKCLKEDEGPFSLFLRLFLMSLQLDSWQVWWGLGQRSSGSCESMWQTTVSKLRCHCPFSDVSVTSFWSCDLLLTPFSFKGPTYTSSSLPQAPAAIAECCTLPSGSHPASWWENMWFAPTQQKQSCKSHLNSIISFSPCLLLLSLFFFPSLSLITNFCSRL